MLRKRVKEAWAFQQSKFLPCVHFFFLSFFLGVKVLHCTYLYLPPFLISPFPQPLPILQSSPVTLAFSPNVNPNRLSTEGYCSSSQKRRQIFRYWGAADFDLCVAMPIFWEWFGDDSGALWWFFISLLGVVGWLMAIPALHRGASHGPCMAALWFHWVLTDPHILPPIYRQLHFFNIK